MHMSDTPAAPTTPHAIGPDGTHNPLLCGCVDPSDTPARSTPAEAEPFDEAQAWADMAARRGDPELGTPAAEALDAPNDQREHVLDESCWCDPYPDQLEPRVIIHRKEGKA